MRFYSLLAFHNHRKVSQGSLHLISPERVSRQIEQKSLDWIVAGHQDTVAKLRCFDRQPRLGTEWVQYQAALGQAFS